MYLDSILFAIGAVLLLAFAVLAMIIGKLWNRWKEDDQVVRESGTERVDVLATISKKVTESGGVGSGGGQATEKLGDWTAAHPGEKLDTSALDGKYQLLKEIHEGNMSRLFLAQGMKMGNPCVVKFIAQADGDMNLADEAEILKKLNHPGLPQVLDIFRSKQGMFLVERQVEGYSLRETMRHMNGELTRRQVCDWGIQLAQVLHYLHNLEVPIYHCDLKPSNIMITHDNRLVLVDFGISRRHGAGGDVQYATYAYAAPELLTGAEQGVEIIQKKFGKLPPDSAKWGIDERTDLYSVGVVLYELLTGKLPERGKEKEIYCYATQELGDIIRKCMSAEPKKRYHSAKELMMALESVQNRWNAAPHRLRMRKVALFACALLLAGTMGTTASAAYIRSVENAARVTLSPGYVAVSPHQSIPLKAENIYSDGNVRDVDLDQMEWSYSEDNIVRVDGGRLMGLQVGSVTVTGKHRSATAVIEVEVTEPVEAEVAVSLQYVEGASLSVYAGGMGRDFADGSLHEGMFVSPECLECDGQTLWITDSGSIRVIRNDTLSTVQNLPTYLRAKLVRRRGSALVFLTEDWEEEDGSYRYGIAEYSPTGGTETLYETESGVTAIHDIAVSSDGTIWLIQENFLEGKTRLYALNSARNFSFITELPDSATNLCFDDAENLYISAPKEGMIYRLKKSANELNAFAGGKDERNFIDGTIPNFYNPTSMVWADGSLFVLDFDTVREIVTQGDNLLFVETLAGTPVADTNAQVSFGTGNKATLSAATSATLAVAPDGAILLSDPKNSAIYRLTVPERAAT